MLIAAVAIHVWCALAIVTFYRLVSGQLPDTRQDYGEGEPNDWEIR